MLSGLCNNTFFHILSDDILESSDIKSLKLVSKGVNLNTKRCIRACFINSTTTKILEYHISRCLKDCIRLESLAFGPTTRPYLPPNVPRSLQDISAERYSHPSFVESVSRVETLNSLQLYRVDSNAYSHLYNSYAKSITIDITETDISVIKFPKSVKYLTLILSGEIKLGLVETLQMYKDIVDISFVGATSVDDRALIELISLKKIKVIDFTGSSIYKSEVMEDILELTQIQILGLKERTVSGGGYGDLFSLKSMIDCAIAFSDMS